ncbi:MAG: TonB-dependent receptor [Mangrovibacterium sp.]
MKLTTCLIFAIVLSVNATGYSQATRLNLVLHNGTLIDALTQIENQSDFSFYYNKEEVGQIQGVSVQIKGESIQAVLDHLLANTGFEYRMIDRYIVVKKRDDASFSGVAGQHRAISGKVTDSSDTPLPGVTVVVKGTTQGTITDADGNYSLSNVSGDATLVFSFVGMKSQEIPVSGKTTINVVMVEETIGIGEVVAIGYGTMKKSDLTGSVVSADIDAFRESPNVSIVQSLQGSVPGLSVGQVTSAGQNPSILIRGQNTFNSSNTAPLLVVDGVIFVGQLIDLNPVDIESVDVLKDASSTAVYGSRAANGVILITTKRGKSGKPVFNYTASYTIQTPAKVLDFLNREEFIEKTRDALWETGYLASDYTQPNPDFDPTTSWTAENRQGYDNGTEFDWWDAATQTGHIQTHNLSMSGKNDRTTYFISVGFTDQLGYIENDKYKRYSVRLNIENEILKWFKIGVQSYFTSNDYSGTSPNMGNIYRMSPLTSPYDENGELINIPYGMNVPNPFFNREIDNLSKQLRLNANFYSIIDVPFVKGLSYRFNYSQTYRPARAFDFDPNGASYLGSASKFNGTQYEWTFDNILTYIRSFNNHHINITLVAGREEREYESTTASANSFSNMDLGYNKMNVAENQFTSSSAWDESSLYYMARAHYDFNKKYLATFTVRRDGFSGFSKDNKFGIFPSGAVAWVVSEENFMKIKPLTIEFLKFRVSYGVNGNRTLGRYATLAQVAASPVYIFGDGAAPSIGQYLTSLANNSLKWETTTGFNLGIDFSLLNQRFSGSIDYYNNNTKNILYDINIPIITGYPSITDNLGKIHNKGVEFAINTVNVKTKDFSWDMGINFSLNRNEIRSIIGLDNDGDGREDDLIANSLFIGKPLGVIYSYEIEGMYQLGDVIPAGYRPGHYKIKNLNPDVDEIITPEFDRKILGYTDPSYRFGINNAFRYKNWTLRAFINSIQGGKNYYYTQNDPSVAWGKNDEATNSNSVKYDYWTPSNPDAKYQQLFYPSKTPAARYQQRNFVRLQDISLAYRFDQNLIKKVGLQELQVYASGKNLYTWTKWKGWDPETGQGIIQGGSPVLKSYSLGINVTF